MSRHRAPCDGNERVRHRARTPRLVSALLGALAVVIMVVSPAGASGSASPTTTTTTASLSLAGQTSFVEESGTWQAQLVVDDPDPSTDTLVTAVYSRLHSRSEFDQAVSGHPLGYQEWDTAPQRIASLSSGAPGRVTVRVPVDTGTSGQFTARSGSAVYPVVLQVYSRVGVPLGSPLVTFLVYAASPTAGQPRLAVSLTVPVALPAASATSHALSASESSVLSVLASTLAGVPSVPVSLQIEPALLDLLASGGATDRATLARLASATGSDQVLAASYYPVDLSALWVSGLGQELAAQYDAGAAAFATYLGARPSRDIVVSEAGLDGDAFAAVMAQGASRMVVPDSSLTPLPSSYRQLTPAAPTEVIGVRGGASAEVMASDAGLSQYLTADTDPVLAAEQLLAGLSLVQLEEPSVARGIALLAPAGTPVDPTVLRTLLGGLAGHPLLDAVTADGLFSAAPAATPPVTRALVNPHGGVALAAAAQLRTASTELDGLASITPSDSKLVAAARLQLLLGTSSLISGSERARIAAQVRTGVARAEAGISLPGSSSVTLTSTKGTIPLTVLSNPTLRARVRLTLTASKLTFRPFASGAGSCTPENAVSEVCELTLAREATTLRIPVGTRTSGVFSMEVVLASPDGSVVLASNRDTVRSTAFSGVGVALIVVAVLGLVAWWIRDARHGRRARQLVQRPSDRSDVAPGPSVDPESGTRRPAEAPGPTVASLPAAPPAPRPGPPAPPGSRPGPQAEPRRLLEDVPPFPARQAQVGPSSAVPERDVDDGPTLWLDDDPVIAEFFSSPPPHYGERASGS